MSLIGYRGTGKSTVGKILAHRLGWNFYDSDEQIERASGQSIASLFETLGEPGFRELEFNMIKLLSAEKMLVLSLGGGAILNQETRRQLIAAGPVVWLTASPQAIWERISSDPTTRDRRPNLTPQGGLAEIEHVLAFRTPLYAECATWALDTEELSPEEIAAEIQRRMTLAT